MLINIYEHMKTSGGRFHFRLCVVTALIPALHPGACDGIQAYELHQSQDRPWQGSERIPVAV